MSNSNKVILAVIIFLLIVIGVIAYKNTQTGGGEVSTNLIRVEVPKPQAHISSPLTFSGEARGNWYFEASFPVRVLDGDGAELGVGIATAQGEWMTPEFVPFRGTVAFKTPKSATGTVVFQKDNASGLPEHDAEVRVPIVFKKDGNTATATGGCFIGGCSGQVCSDQEDVITTCEFRPEYACYQSARCERQASGQCGWTQTAALQACLQNPPQL